MDDGFIPPVGGNQQASYAEDLINPPPSQFQQPQGSDPMDPTGVWTKFLSTPGHPATQQQVQAFVGGLIKQLGLQIQNEMARAKKTAERMKRALEGQ